MAVKQRKDYHDTDEGRDVLDLLRNMSDSQLYNTTASYSSKTAQYPDNLIPFADKHMNYLISHPSLDAGKYISNLKMMTLVR